MSQQRQQKACKQQQQQKKKIKTTGNKSVRIGKPASLTDNTVDRHMGAVRNLLQASDEILGYSRCFHRRLRERLKAYEMKQKKMAAVNLNESANAPADHGSTVNLPNSDKGTAISLHSVVEPELPKGDLGAFIMRAMTSVGQLDALFADVRKCIWAVDKILGQKLSARTEFLIRQDPQAAHTEDTTDDAACIRLVTYFTDLDLARSFNTWREQGQPNPAMAEYSKSLCNDMSTGNQSLYQEACSMYTRAVSRGCRYEQLNVECRRHIGDASDARAFSALAALHPSMFIRKVKTSEFPNLAKFLCADSSLRSRAESWATVHDTIYTKVMNHWRSCESEQHISPERSPRNLDLANDDVNSRTNQISPVEQQANGQNSVEMDLYTEISAELFAIDQFPPFPTDFFI